MSEIKKSEILVSGMTCDGCARRVATALRKVEGVRDVIVLREEGRAIIEHAGVEPSDLAAAATKAGYPADWSPLG